MTFEQEIHNGMMAPVRTKVFEIRDRMTFIPVIATTLISCVAGEDYLLGRAGYHALDSLQVLVTRLDDHSTASDWGFSSARTMPIAHRYIQDHFYELETGAVIDVEFILGETTVQKESERLAEVHWI